MRNKNTVVWEIQKGKDKIYLYKLVSSESNEPRYIGTTNNPTTRLSHHLKETEKKYKNSWIKGVMKRGGKIIMVVFDCANTYKEALVLEEQWIRRLKNLTNHCLTPTTPNTKKCFLYDLKTEEIISFKSVGAAAVFVGIHPTTFFDSLKIMSRYLFSYKNNFEELLKRKYTVKLKKDGVVKYAVSYLHASWICGCSVNMVNLCIRQDRKYAKGWVIARRGERFHKRNIRTEKQVECINDKKVFRSLKQASEYYEVDHSCITKCCSGKRKHVAGLVFRYK